MSSHPAACGATDTIRQRRHAFQGSLRFSLRIVPSLLHCCRFSPVRLWPSVISKHDATNNSDVVSNNNEEKRHVKVIRFFKACMTRQF
ncbi:hypothetical protein F3J12_01910 [Burkholderia sp. Ax-1735]|nr:hypothetical protein [Burkholderia sp. Ap-955]NIF08334.1 hypothetical protein [Burkholderia sp. Ax-1735]NIG00988.1 hypothetical protein [Burkholderia sp. Tr-849]